jgi:hypothetical protein
MAPLSRGDRGDWSGFAALHGLYYRAAALNRPAVLVQDIAAGIPGASRVDA